MSVGPGEGRHRQRCSDAARRRGDPLLATAPPAHRLLLLEVPGPWGSAGLGATRLPVEVSRPLAAAADAAGVRVQLLRAPGRPAKHWPGHFESPPAGGYRWALADVEIGVLRWGRWYVPADLPMIDVTEPLAPLVHAATGPQRLALVCTHAKHDVCCAVRGRPVAAAVARDLDRQAWETSHLGGDRFAANLLLLPEGEMFGNLDADSAVGAARRLDAGHLTLDVYRGRAGRPPVAQAAAHLAAVELGDDRRAAVRLVGSPRRVGADWAATVAHEGRRYTLRLAESWAEPERLTCAALEAKPARRFSTLSLEIEERART